MPSRFNHMELTVARGTLDEPSRSEITRFYSEIFGWNAIDVKVVQPNDLLLATDAEVSQFILLSETEHPMQSPGYDHLGLLQDSRAQVDELLERCRKYQSRDERVRIKEYDDLDQGDLKVHAFYVKYLLPIWFDVQVLEWPAGKGPGHRWRYD